MEYTQLFHLLERLLFCEGGTCSGAGGSVQTPSPVGKYGRCARSAGIHQAVRAINPSAQVSVNAGDLDQMTWHGGTEVISKSDIQAKQAEMNTICAADPTTPKVGMTRMEQNIAKAGYFDKLYAGRKLISDERKAEIATCAIGPRSEWTC
ncbi:MAG TPA: hypothetical protein EYO37_07335 [Nitrospina sp.]|nr:hypothetical protein [Nitrospina sp.]